MKIAIITFHASYNCGSILQCMALKEVLEKKGAEVDIINFSSEEQQKLYSVFYKKLTIKNVVKNILCIPGYSKIGDHYSQYKQYIKKVFDLKGDFYKTSEEIKQNISKYDMFIAGGDQIWNVNCDDFSPAYFLDFDESTYKISYSPSLGATDINQSSKADEYKKLLERFDAISCREVNGAKWLQKLTGREVDLLLDPTLLLNSDEWRERIQPNLPLPCKEEFIFYYAFSYSSENNKRVQQLAEENNLKVLIIDAKQWYIKRLSRYKNFILCDETGPNAFLNLMDKAKYVITTSFHGTAFSLNFHKKFIYINNVNHNPTDDRTSFLLEQLDMMDRYIYPEEVTTEKVEQSIDYHAYEEKIALLKSKAFQYLDINMRKALEK